MAGFSADSLHPFYPSPAGQPRTKPLFDFNKSRILTSLTTPAVAQGDFQYLPPNIQSPYVYFRARKERWSPATELFGTTRWEYGYILPDNSGNPSKFVPLRYAPPPQGTVLENIAVAYFDTAQANPPADPRLPATVRSRRNEDKFQIVAAGLDHQFDMAENSSTDDVDSAQSPDLQSSNKPHRFFRYTRSGVSYSTSGMTTTLMPWMKANMDNLTNFSDGTLEDELP